MPEEPLPRRSATARREEILRRLHAAGFLSVTALTHDLGVSDMTVRRDLRLLEAAGQVRVVHGGASLPHGVLRTADFASRGHRESSAKQRIARHAVSLAGPGSTLVVDAGTTPYELAAALPDSFDGTVITHSVPVLQRSLHLESARVIGLGGELLGDSQALVGPAAVEALTGLRADFAFLGAAAVSPRGVYVARALERPTKLALMEAADRVILLVDHTKFTARAPVRLAPLEALDVLVTDARPPRDVASALRAAGVEVQVASPDVATGRTGRRRA